ncbi:MAG TPA: 5'/3'-nucleotidase SurE [Smithella sp.]|jgi:5'-nucleotidase|nr:5'/3'-nucleotidase SurE [Smithella sp.]NMC97612.1 5'/3'-nucleotidase SurE [Deltaproteobacteria bacterium]HNQ65619.1 5'/3'-nucleotidase SurE [Smithella sp.]HOG10231.1 5'/3'-nucleotidase SurE [Smithella sp.]HOO36075.1 5'/3'-nucleotidase SurE [Smithella sp.]
MRFLLTNDDGIYAKGLSALYKELSKEADCLIVAPETEQSAVGHAITISRPLMVRRATKNNQFLGYAVCGTPADCVKLGIKELSDHPVDLVVSGINRGGNAGINVLYSGTVSAATEAAIMGFPSMAVSLDTHKEADFTFAAKFARKMTRMILNHREQLLGSAINVNVPCLPQGKIKGVVVVRQAQTNIVEYFEKRTDPRENTYYWFAGESSSATRQKDTDVGALTSGFITVTPIHFDLTRHDLLDQLKDALEKNRF